MSTIPKFEDTDEIQDVPSFDDTTAVNFDDTVDVDAPQKIPDADLPKLKSFSEQWDEIKSVASEAPGKIVDRWEDFKEGIPLSEGARKLGAMAAPGNYEDNIAAQKKTSTERHVKDPTGSTVAKGAGGFMAPATAGMGFMKRVLVDAGLSASDAATRANEMKDSFNEALNAGGISAAINLLVSGLGTAGKTAGKLDEFAERRAVKSLDPILSQQERLADKGAVNRLGREMLDGDIVKFGSSTDEIADNLETVLKRDGTRIGEIRKEAEEAGANIDLSRLAKKGDALVGFSGATNPAAQDAMEQYADTAASLATVPNRSLSQAQEEITDLSKRVNFKSPTNAIPPAQQEAFRKVRADMVDLSTDQIRQKTPQNVDEYSGLLDRFSLFKDGDEIAQKAVARQSKNSDMGLRSSILANRAAQAGGPEGVAKGVTMMMVEKLVKERGNAAIAVGADKAAKLLDMGPGALGKYAKVLSDAANKGSANFAMTHGLLMKDPEYKAIIEQESAP